MKHGSKHFFLIISAYIMLISLSAWSQDTDDSLSSVQDSNTSIQVRDENIQDSSDEAEEISQELLANDTATASYKPKVLDFKISLNPKDHPVLKHLDSEPIMQVESYRAPKNLETPFLISIIGLLLTALLFYRNRAYLNHLVTAFKNPNLTQRQLKEMIQQNSLVNSIFNLLALLSFAFYAFVFLKQIQFKLINNWSDTQLLIGLIIAFIVGYSLRVLFQKLIGYIFEISEEMNIYVFQLLLTAKVLGILLIPFTILLYFGEGDYLNTILNISIFLILVSLLLKYLRSGFLFKAFIGFSKFHFILYLCASEILPFLILLKLLMII